MQVQLEVSHSKANVNRVVLRSDTVIGRSADCNLRIASSQISRQHCAILLGESDVRIRDLGSSNGTFVNGRQIAPNSDVRLSSGAQISLGGVKFVVRFDAPEAPPQGPDSTVEWPVPQGLTAGAAKANGLEAATPPADTRSSERAGGSFSNGARAESRSAGREEVDEPLPIDEPPELLETISLEPEETVAERRDRESGEPADDDEDSGSEDVSEPAAAGGLWSSLLGLFRRRSVPPDHKARDEHAPDDPPPIEEAADETILELSESEPDEERAAANRPPAGRGAQPNDDATEFLSADQDDEQSAEPPAEDPQLGDFLKHLGRE